MSESRNTLNLAGAARYNDGGSDGGGTRKTLQKGDLTEANVAELADLYGKKIGGQAPTEELTEAQIREALILAGQQSGAAAADVGGHKFEINPQKDTGKDAESTDEIELPGYGYARCLKIVRVLTVVLLLLASFRTEIAELVGWQKFMDDLAEPEKLNPAKFQEMLDQQLDQHHELTSLKKNKGLNEFLQRMRLDLCPDEEINSMQPQDIVMLKDYGFAVMKMFQANCAKGDAGKNLVLVMSDNTSVEFRFEGEENAVKISSMVASGGARCTVDLGEKLLISCPEKDSGMEDFRVYVGEEFCIQKMVVGDKVYTYDMNDGQCVKVDVSGWAEVRKAPVKAVEPLKSNKPRKQVGRK